MMPSWFATPVVDSLLFVLSALEHHGVQYVAHKGLLLGAVRLGGLLPWDDDSDAFLVETSPDRVEKELGPVCESHGFVLRFRKREGYFFAYPRTAIPFALSGLTELGLLTRTVVGGTTHFDAHERRRHLLEGELFPLRRIPFYGSYLLGPARAETALDRMYGPLASSDVMHRFAAPRIASPVAEFWRTARPLDGTLDWPRISARFRERSRNPAFHLAQIPCGAWHVANRAHWIATDLLRRLGGGHA